MTATEHLANINSYLVWGVMITYFIIVLGFGGFFGRHTKSTKDFFFSGQRFSWWLVAFSCVATVVGSYSFIKYAERGLTFGMSSTMTYLNDWFLAPLFILGWMPLVYYARVQSIPEYFERRFNRPTRIMSIIFIMLYMVGYIGINLYTLGLAVNKIAPLDNFVIQQMDKDSYMTRVTWEEVTSQRIYIPSDEDGNPLPPDSEELRDISPDTVVNAIDIRTPEQVSRFLWALIIAVIAGVYVTFGGQTAVIMTDLLQGFLLLVVGLALFYWGFTYLGANVEGQSGIISWWKGMPPDHQLPFSGFNRPGSFPMVGIFWQDFFGSSMFFWFANQGLIMRFLAVKSVNEGRKAFIAVILILMPLAAISVANTGWIGAAMQQFGLMSKDIDPNNAFVLVSAAIIKSDILFGVILAAITAALMSTVDTLINAVSAIAVNDVWRPFVVKKREDRYYLKVARIFSMVFTLGGLLLVPVYMGFESIYEAHGALTAAVSPPIIVTIILGVLWKKFSGRAAFITLLLGGFLMLISIKYPALIAPFAKIHGMDMESGMMKSITYMRALYGVLLCAAIAVPASLIWPNRDEKKIEGMWVGALSAAKRYFKGGEPNDLEPGEKIWVTLTAGEEAEDKTGAFVTGLVRMSQADADKMKAKPGDLVYVADKRWWLGGLRSMHATLDITDVDEGEIVVPVNYIDQGRLRTGEQVLVEKII